MTYVDGFVLPVPKSEFEGYRKKAELAKEVWLQHGALSYVEARDDDVPDGELTSFARAVRKEEADVIVFSYITYKSREHRDEVLGKVMKRFEGEPMPSYLKRMMYGGFEVFIEG